MWQEMLQLVGETASKEEVALIPPMTTGVVLSNYQSGKSGAKTATLDYNGNDYCGSGTYIANNKGYGYDNVNKVFDNDDSTSMFVVSGDDKIISVQLPSAVKITKARVVISPNNGYYAHTVSLYSSTNGGTNPIKLLSQNVPSSASTQTTVLDIPITPQEGVNWVGVSFTSNSLPYVNEIQFYGYKM